MPGHGDRGTDVTARTALLSVLVPVYNEEQTVETMLEHVLAQLEVGEVIAVDDGSTDGSWDILARIAARDGRLRLIRFDRNRGKGAAVRRAIEEIRLPYAIVQDADLEYDPSDYAALLEPLLEGRTDVTYGARGFRGQTAYSYWYVLGNRFVTFCCNILFNCYILDMTTCYKLLRSELWRRLRLSGERFDIDAQISGRVLRLGYRIHEVPVTYYARSRAEGKKLTWRDGISLAWALLRIRLSSMRDLFGGPDLYHEERHRALALQHPLITRLSASRGGSDTPAPQE